MTREVPEEADGGGWERVERDPIHKDLIVVILACALGLIIFLRGLNRLPEGSTTIGLALTCTSFIAVLVCFLAFMMWKMRRVRSDATRRSVGHPWKRVADGVEEVLDGQGVEFEREVRGWRRPSYNWAYGNFRQVYHLPRTDLRIYIESRDPKGTGERGPPTDLSIGPVTDENRAFVDGLTGLLDEVMSGEEDSGTAGEARTS